MEVTQEAVDAAIRRYFGDAPQGKTVMQIVEDPSGAKFEPIDAKCFTIDGMVKIIQHKVARYLSWSDDDQYGIVWRVMPEVLRDDVSGETRIYLRFCITPASTARYAADTHSALMAWRQATGWEKKPRNVFHEATLTAARSL